MTFNRPSTSVVFLAACFLAFTCIASKASGQETTAPVAAAAPIDPAVFETLRSHVQQSQLSEAEQKQILDIVAQGETQAMEAIAKVKQAEAMKAAVVTVPERVASAKSELERLKDFKAELPDGQTLAELESLLASLQTKLDASKQAIVDAEQAMSVATQRRREIDVEKPELEKEISQRQSQIDVAKANPGSSLLDEAKRAELIASHDLLLARVNALDSESALIDAESPAGLPQLIRDLRVRESETLQQQFAVVKAAVEAERAKDAAQRVETAEAQLSKLHRALLPIGQQNRDLATSNQSLAGKIEEVEVTLAARKLRLDEVRTAFEQAKTRVTTVGLTDAVGALLRNLQQSLPNVGAYRLRVRERQPTINEAQFDLIDLTDRRNAKLDILIATLFRTADPPIATAQRETLAEEARRLLEEQRTEFLDPAIRSQTAYFNALVSLSTTEQQIVQLVDEATVYVNSRVLWIRSSKPLSSQLIPTQEELWFMIPAAWGNVPVKLLDDLKQRYALWLAAFLSLVALLRIRYRLRNEILSIGQRVTQSSYTKFMPTIQSLLMTIATAAPLTLVFGFVGWRLSRMAGSDQATVALSQAASAVALAYFPVELLRQVCRPGGLAVCHFEYPAQSVSLLRSNLRWLLVTTLPLLMITSFLNANGSTFGRDTLERYFYLSMVGTLCIFVARVLHPRTGLPGSYLRSHSQGWASRLSYVWYPLSISIPFALGVLAFIGYYFTSQQLGWRLFRSLWILFVIGLIISVVLRWALVHRRKLRIEQSRERRAAEVPPSVGEVPYKAAEASPEALRVQMHQTRRLMQTVMVTAALLGLWLVWRDVLPALDFLEEWPLWQSTDTITEVIPSTSGELKTQTREVLDNITIADLGLGMLIVFVTLMAVRNIPGLLEFAVLRRLPLDNSIRYAITTLVSYAIVLFGLIIACQAIGLHWSQIQWMATALTFGLAFGLQEMFANFIAGIIILFEQPVRVGDVVEIDGVTGVVTRIRIRATTITNWDRKDFIVPNKEFITGKLLNWTRSDEITRLVIEVGIAYGSDTDRARELLVQAATEHDDVMSEPPPMAVFQGFGDSSLLFSVRAYIDRYEKRLLVTHDLHTAIDKAFRAENIEISFPQRDLHIRSLPQPLRRIITAGDDQEERGNEMETD